MGEEERTGSSSSMKMRWNFVEHPIAKETYRPIATYILTIEGRHLLFKSKPDKKMRMENILHKRIWVECGTKCILIYCIWTDNFDAEISWKSQNIISLFGKCEIGANYNRKCLSSFTYLLCTSAPTLRHITLQIGTISLNFLSHFGTMNWFWVKKFFVKIITSSCQGSCVRTFLCA